jgi:hypothetical protein
MKIREILMLKEQDLTEDDRGQMGAAMSRQELRSQAGRFQAGLRLLFDHAGAAVGVARQTADSKPEAALGGSVAR